MPITTEISKDFVQTDENGDLNLYSEIPTDMSELTDNSFCYTNLKIEKGHHSGGLIRAYKNVSVGDAGLELCTISGEGTLTKAMTIGSNGVNEINFGEINLENTWFGPDLRGGLNISGGGWYLVEDSKGMRGHLNEKFDFNENSDNFQDALLQNEGVRNTRSVSNTPLASIDNVDEILIYSHDGSHDWWVIDNSLFRADIVDFENAKGMSRTGAYTYDVCHPPNSMPNGIKYQKNSDVPAPLAFCRHYGDKMSIWNGAPTVYDYATIIYRSDFESGPSEHNMLSSIHHKGISIFVRNSTNIQINPIPYPTMIKKELDHLHITAPLSIYPENNKLDDLGLSWDKVLKFDGNNETDNTVTVDNAGGWYLVRQTYDAPLSSNPLIYNDNFHFGFDYGTKEDESTYPSGHSWSRNVSNYDYDEVLFYMDDAGEIVWQIWDRTALESLMSRYNASYVQVSGVKKSSVSSTPHTVEAHVRAVENGNCDPQILYSKPGIGSSHPNRRWNDFDNGAFARTYYVRRSDGQPVRLKNKVKVYIDGNLDVDGKITCSNIIPSSQGNIEINADKQSMVYIKGINRNDDLNSCLLTLHANTQSSKMTNGWGPTISFVTNRTGKEGAWPAANIKGCIYSGANTGWDYYMLAIDVYGDQLTRIRGLEIRAASPFSALVANCYCPGAFHASTADMTTSDDRMKFYETNIDNALSLINKLKPKKYEKYTPSFDIMKGAWMPKESEWETVKKNNYINEFGLIAQDIRAIPELSFLVTGNEHIEEIECVSESKYNNLNKEEQVEYTEFYYYSDASGEQITDIQYNNLDNEKKTLYTLTENRNYRKTILTDQSLYLNYAGIFIINIAAVKELSKENDAKTEKITELESRCTEAEAKIAKLEADMKAIKAKLGL